ncbi:MAG: hypothetical protein NVSMB2_00870 [Chloroflexota bacterium]
MHPPLALNDRESLEAIEAVHNGPALPEDRGLYAVLGLTPSASDAEIGTAYRRQAARLLRSRATNSHAMRELNVAYEVLGNPVRRAEYDRLRRARAFTPNAPTPLPAGPKMATRVGKRTRPRHAVQPRYAGLPDVFVVVVVVGLAVLAGALLIPRLSVNLSALNALQGVIPNAGRARPTAVPTSASAPATLLPAPTVAPGLAERFAGSAVNVTDPTPVQNASESVQVRLRSDGGPAANVGVWALVQYRTTQERWPAVGTAMTDNTGAATITFNVGSATPGYAVAVRVYAQVDTQQLTWSTSFTPR